MGILAIICGILLIILNNWPGANNSKVMQLLQENYESVEQLEDFFADATYSKLDFNDAFTSEMHETLNQNLTNLEGLKISLEKTKPSTISSDVQQSFIQLRERLTERAPRYRESVTLYNSIYDAYTNDNPDNLLPFMESTNYYVSISSERIYNYLNSQQQLVLVIEDNDCYMDARSEFCEQVLEEYFNNIISLSSSTQVVSAIFMAYYDGSYAEENRSTPLMQILLEELE